jgi:hypothetical protein
MNNNEYKQPYQNNWSKIDMVLIVLNTIEERIQWVKDNCVGEHDQFLQYVDQDNDCLEYSIPKRIIKNSAAGGFYCFLRQKPMISWSAEDEDCYYNENTGYFGRLEPDYRTEY